MVKAGIIPTFILLQFSLAYITLNDNLKLLSIPIAFLILFIELIYLSVKYNGQHTGIKKGFIPTYIYSLLLVSVILASSIFALDPLYSSIRGMITVILFAILITVYYEVNTDYYNNKSWRNLLTIIFFVTQLIILFGQLIMPDWTMGQIRMTGGTNPNQVSFFALFIIFMTHYSVLIENRWSKLHISNFILALVFILWSMSRSMIGSLVIFYALYSMYKIFYDDLLLLLNGKLRLQTIKKVVILLLLLSVSTFGFKKINKLPIYEDIVLRFTSEDGFDSRNEAWRVLLNYFYDNPLIGGVGWWNSSRLLSSLGDITSSSHSLYIRLLSEVGILGLIIVIIFPLIITLKLFQIGINESIERNTKLKSILVASFLVAIFAGQFFENRYLVGFLGLGNNIFLWSLALGIFLIGNYKKLNTN